MKSIQFFRNDKAVSGDDIKATDVFHMHDVSDTNIAIRYLSREFYCAMKGLPYRAEDEDR